MHRQASQHESRLGRDPPGHIHDLVERHSELRGLLAGLRVGMRRFRRHIGIRANADSRRHLHLVRDRDDRVELARRFDIDESHAGADCFLDFRVRLADAREHDAVRVEARGPRAAQLPHGHDIRAGTELLQHAQDTEVAVGFDGVANAMADVVEGIGESVVLRANQVRAVDVGRRSYAIRDRLKQPRVEA